MPETREKKIVERMLDARVKWLLKNLPLDGIVCKLPPADYEEWEAWIFTIDNDPVLGYKKSGLIKHAFGMDIVRDASVPEILVVEKR